MTDLQVTYRNLHELKPWKNNPRTHSKKQIRQIADSIKHFGFTNPVLIDDDNGVIAGQRRLKTHACVRSAFPPRAAAQRTRRHFAFVPIPDMPAVEAATTTRRLMGV